LEMLEITRSIKKLDLLSLFKIDFSMRGLLNPENVFRDFSRDTRNRYIEECKLPFAAISFDLANQKTVCIRGGHLASAMLASASLPIFFPPFQYQNRSLIDGGIEYPLPLAFTNSLPETDVLIAVNVLPGLSHEAEMIRLVPQNRNPKHSENVLDTFLKATFYNQAYLAISAALQYRPDIFISATSNELRPWDFDEGEAFFNLGVRAAQTALEKFEDLSYWEQLFSRYENRLNRFFIKNQPKKL